MTARERPSGSKAPVAETVQQQYVSRLVEAAPAITGAQRDRLAGLLRGSAA